MSKRLVSQFVNVLVDYSRRFFIESTFISQNLYKFELQPFNANYMCQVREADACLLLANKYCQDPDAEDAGDNCSCHFKHK